MATVTPGSGRRFRRVLLKISGESFAAEGKFGISPEELSAIAGEIASAKGAGPLDLAVVVGGGNIIRRSRRRCTRSGSKAG